MEEEDEGRIAQLIKNAKLEDSDEEQQQDAVELTKKQMIADGWIVADESNLPSLPPMRPPPLLPPRIDIPEIFNTKIEYNTSHMWNEDLVHSDDNNIIVVNESSLLSKYEVTDVILGDGACSQVRLGKDKRSGTDVAIKIVSSIICEIVPSTSWHQIAQNISVCKSDYIISILNDYSDENGTYLVLERLPGVFCQLLVNTKSEWNSFRVANVVYQLLNALSVVHRNKLIHGDLSSGNVLAVDSTLDRIKLSGFAKCSPVLNSTGNLCSTKIKAPEVLENGSGNQLVDIWALGCYTYLLITGNYPFYDKNSVLMKSNIMKEEPVYPSHIDDSCKSFLRRFLKKSPKDRYSADKALQHRWITERNDKKKSLVV